MSGTDLIRLFKGTINHFWTTDLSQIYRALESLEREGCVTSESVPSRRGPARRVYTLTADGARRVAGAPVTVREIMDLLDLVTGEGPVPTDAPSDPSGEHEPFRNERADGLASLKWIAAQPWCNGSIGMWGSSYSGFSALILADSKVPAFKSIFSISG